MKKTAYRFDFNNACSFSHHKWCIFEQSLKSTHACVRSSCAFVMPVKNTHTHFVSPSPFKATVGRRKVCIYRKLDWLKWLNDWLCGKTLYLTRHDVNTRLDCCHGFSLTWLRRLLLISNAEGQMLRSVIGSEYHTYTNTQTQRDIPYTPRLYWKRHCVSGTVVGRCGFLCTRERINIALNGWKTIFT